MIYFIIKIQYVLMRYTAVVAPAWGGTFLIVLLFTFFIGFVHLRTKTNLFFRSSSLYASPSRTGSLAYINVVNWIRAVIWVSTYWLRLSSCMAPFLGTALKSSHRSKFGMVSSRFWHRGKSTFSYIPSKSFLNPLKGTVAQKSLIPLYDKNVYSAENLKVYVYYK